MDRKQIEDALAALPGWEYDGTKLVRRVPVADDAQDNLESAVMKVADELDHHPVIERGAGELRFDVWSHSAGGVTAKDLELAARIDQTLAAPSRTDRPPQPHQQCVRTTVRVPPRATSDTRAGGVTSGGAGEVGRADEPASLPSSAAKTGASGR